MSFSDPARALLLEEACPKKCAVASNAEEPIGACSGTTVFVISSAYIVIPTSVVISLISLASEKALEEVEARLERNGLSPKR